MKISGIGSVALAVATVAAVGVIGYGVTAMGDPAVKHAGQTPGYTPPLSLRRPLALMWGDSFFNGSLGIPASGTFAGLAGDQLGYQTLIGGHGGTGYMQTNGHDQTPDYGAQIKAGALKMYAAADISLVVVEGGIDDEHFPPAQVQAAAVPVLAQFKKTFTHARVVVLGPVDHLGHPDGHQAATSAAIHAAARQDGLPYIDPSDWITPANYGQIISPIDHTHPTEAGHRALAAMLVAALRKVGVRSPS